ncbi:hypothetical protein F4803DRAFT_545629 [Xylaria telfairii]|nr:hypothetical protein F4803DRAFT_545629 [Xylaria telfairii]
MNTSDNSQDNAVQIRVQDPSKSPLIYADIAEKSMQFTYGGVKDALTLTFHRTIRIPDNHKSINSLPPNMGEFQIYKVQDYVKQVPMEVAKKSGLFLTMYQREAMWIRFHAILPFAIRVFVGGINAVSGFPMDQRAKQPRKKAAVRKEGEPVQDYMVVPSQPWLDGIVCEDGKVRQFVAQPRGSGFSVEQQITGGDTEGGIQVEIIPIKCGPLPDKLDVLFVDGQGRQCRRGLNLAQMGLGESSTWNNMKVALSLEFGVPVNEQVLSPYVEWNHYLPIRDDAKIGEYYFRPGFVLRLSRDARHAAHPPRVPLGGSNLSHHDAAEVPPSYSSIANQIGQMSVAAGGLMVQNIMRDNNPQYTWKTDAAILFHIHILDTATFAAVMNKPPPPTPISAKTYKEHPLALLGFRPRMVMADNESSTDGLSFYKMWSEEPTGIYGNFAKVKSIAALEKERAQEEGVPYQEEESVPQQVTVIGRYKSTFVPVGPLN